MKTSDELWEEAERGFARAIESCVPDVEERANARVLLDLAIEAHAASLREMQKSMHAINMAARRAWRARRFARRAELTLLRAAKLHAIANDKPLKQVVAEAIEREAARVPR